MSRQIPYEIRAPDDNRPRDPPAILHAIGVQINTGSHLVRFVAFAALAVFVNLFWQAAVLG